MKVSTKGLLELAEHEGLVPAPYLDSVGVWTFGVGHTKFAGAPDPEQMSKEMPSGEALEEAIDQAIELFREDIAKYEDDVSKAIKVDLKQHEFDALVSFHYNTGGIGRAKLTKAINGGNPDAARHFMGWLQPPEIRKRRTAEMRLFQNGDYDANGDQIPIWSTNGSGKLRKPIRAMSGAELLGRIGVQKTKRKEVVTLKMPSFLERLIAAWAAFIKDTKR